MAPQRTQIDYQSGPVDHLHDAGKGILALSGVLIFPGLGHVFAGQRKAALRWFCVVLSIFLLACSCLSAPSMLPGLLLLLPIGFGVQIAQMFSAFRAGKHSRSYMLRTPPRRYLVAFALMALAVTLGPVYYLALPLKVFVVEAFIMPTSSMSPTVVPLDRILVHKLVPFRRFDIVAITPNQPRAPNEIFVKRVVGFPGDQIEIKNGGLLVNGVAMNPPAGIHYVSTAIGSEPIHRDDGQFGNGIEGHPITLAADEYFFLGDNSPISADSRYWDWQVEGHQPGTLPRSHIKGVATWIYWPSHRWRRLY